MERIKSIHLASDGHLGLQIIFQLLILAFIAVPASLNLMSLNLINWGAFLALILFQYLITQIYFLFSKQNKLSFAKNIVVLIAIEVILFGLMLFGPYTILVKGLLFLQWLLIHLVIGTQNLLPILPPLFIAIEMVIMQNLIEMANANVLVTGFGFISFLFYISLFSWIASFYMERHSMGVEIAGKTSTSNQMLSLLRAFALVAFVIAIALVFLTDGMVMSQGIAYIVLVLVIAIYSTFIKNRI